MTAPGNTPATDDLWAEIVARFLHPSSYAPDTDNEENDE